MDIKNYFVKGTRG